MKITSQKTSATILALSILALPSFAYAVSLIPCGETPFVPGSDPLKTATHPCTFNDIALLVNNIIHFIIYYITVPLVAVAFTVVGANFVLNLDKESARSAAKGQFEMIARGIFWILAGFLLVKTILFYFLSDEQIEFMKFMLDITK